VPLQSLFKIELAAPASRTGSTITVCHLTRNCQYLWIKIF